MVIHITAKIVIFLHQKGLASMPCCLFYCHVTSQHNQKPFKWVIIQKVKDKENRKGNKESQISWMMTSWCGLHFMYATQQFIIIYGHLVIINWNYQSLRKPSRINFTVQIITLPQPWLKPLSYHVPPPTTPYPPPMATHSPLPQKYQQPLTTVQTSTLAPCSIYSLHTSVIPLFAACISGVLNH